MVSTVDKINDGRSRWNSAPTPEIAARFLSVFMRQVRDSGEQVPLTSQMLGRPPERRTHGPAVLAAILELDVRLQDGTQAENDAVRAACRTEAATLFAELADVSDAEGIVPEETQAYIEGHADPDDPRIRLGHLMIEGLGDDFPGARMVAHQAVLALQLATTPTA